MCSGAICSWRCIPPGRPTGSNSVYGSSTGYQDCQVMQVNVDGKGDTPLTEGPQGHSYAAWSPDGEYLAYVSDPARRRAIFAFMMYWPVRTVP